MLMSHSVGEIAGLGTLANLPLWCMLTVHSVAEIAGWGLMPEVLALLYGICYRDTVGRPSLEQGANQDHISNHSEMFFH
jgi:hypothetical protein